MEPAQPRERRSRREWAADKLALLLMPLLLVTLATFLARAHFFAELFTHFRVFYLGPALLMAVLLLALRSWRWAAVAFAIAAIHAAYVLPVYWPVSAPSQPPNLRVFYANVLTSNEDSDRLLKAVRGARPDIVVLLEVNDEWIEAADVLEAEYPHTVKQPQGDNFGIALYSRLPLASSRIVPLGHPGIPAIEAAVTVAGRTVTVLAVHTLPPGDAEMAALRNAGLRMAADISRMERGPVILCGDLNTTPWSPFFGDLLKRSGLVSARRGFGILPTWPTQFRPLMIPLDHCLVSPEIGVKSLRVGPETGSDHLPLIAELVIPSAE